MTDFNKTFCDLHSNQLVSNFCCKDECNIGLCATCICSHTQQHIDNHTAPEYQNIRETYLKMQDSLKTQIISFESVKNRAGQLLKNIKYQRQQIHNTTEQAKRITTQFIHQFYEAKEKDLLRRLQNEEKKLNLHNMNRLESIVNFISRDITQLQVTTHDLNSQNFLENFHRIRENLIINSQKVQRQIEQQLLKNELFEVSTTINTSYIHDLQAALDKSINLKFTDEKNSIPKMECVNIEEKDMKIIEKQINKQSRLIQFEKDKENILGQIQSKQVQSKYIPQKGDFSRRPQSPQFQRSNTPFYSYELNNKEPNLIKIQSNVLQRQFTEPALHQVQHTLFPNQFTIKSNQTSNINMRPHSNLKQNSFSNRNSQHNWMQPSQPVNLKMRKVGLSITKNDKR